MSKVYTFVGKKSGATARLLVTAPQGSTVVATKGSKSVPLVYQTVRRENPEWVGLPSGYTQLKSITSNGTEYVDTGFALSNGYKFGFDVTFIDASTRILLGANSSSNEVILGYNGMTSNYLGGSFSYTWNQNTPYSIELDLASNSSNLVLSVDGTIIRNVSGSGNGKKLFLFGAIGEASSTTVTTTLRQEYRRFYAYYNNNEVAYFVPCKNSQNICGFYDLITNTFTTTPVGSFIAGEVVPQYFESDYYVGNLNEYGEWTVTATKGTDSASDAVEVTEVTDVFLTLRYGLPAEYQQVYYIQSNGNQYVVINGQHYAQTGKTYKSGELYPVYRKADSVAGIFDNETKTFYTNSGTGEFICGVPVNCLPSGCTQLEYIESTGTQYIDTGIKGNYGIGFDIDFTITASEYKMIFGSRNSSSNRFYPVWYRFTNPVSLQTSLGTGDVAIDSTVAVNKPYNIYCKELKKSNETYLINGVSKSVTYKSGTDTGMNLYLFAENNYEQGVYRQAKIKLPKFRLFNNSGMLLDFVPCLDSNNVACLYDVVSETFFYNSGTGDFIAGQPLEVA